MGASTTRNRLSWQAAARVFFVVEYLSFWTQLFSLSVHTWRQEPLFMFTSPSLSLPLTSISPGWSGNCVFSHTHIADAHRCLADRRGCSRVISEVFTLRGPKRPHGEESLPLSRWIRERERERNKEERERERERNDTQSVSQGITLPWCWGLQAAGQEMRRRTPTDLQPLAASQPITETI